MSQQPVRRAIILTALPVEIREVLAHLTDVQEEVHPQGTIYKRGRFEDNGRRWDVAVAMIGQGNNSAALECERAITHFDPHVALFVGVAGGLKKDVRLGDVVVATRVYGYESGKADADFLTRPDVGESSYRLTKRAESESITDKWAERILPPKPHRAPRVFVKPIAAGEKVVSSTRSSTYQFLRTHYNDAHAVEMEGRGFLSAAHANDQVLALIVRGASDRIDRKAAADQAGSQRTASRHASAFAFQILAKLDIDRDETLKDLRERRPNLQDLMPTAEAIGDAINADDPDWRWTLTANDVSRQITIAQRTPGAAVQRPIRVEPRLDLPEGVSMDELVRHAVETQEIISLGPQYVKGFQAYLGDKTLVEIMQPGSLVFATQPLGPAVLRKLVVQGTKTQLEHLQVQAFYLGNRRFRLTNKRHSQAPYIMEVDFTIPVEQQDARGDFHPTADGGSISIRENFQWGHTVNQVLPLFDFLKALQRPCTLLLQEQATGVTNHIMEGVQLLYTDHPHFEQLMADLRTIQNSWPERSFRFPVGCTYEQGAFLHQIAVIIRTGREEGRLGEGSGEVPAGQMEAHLANLPADGIIRGWRFAEHKAAMFLGQTVDMGPDILEMPPIRHALSPDELLRQAALCAPQENIRVKFVPADPNDARTLRTYERFPLQATLHTPNPAPDPPCEA